MEKLIEIIHNPPANWNEENKTAFDCLFGAPNGRYHTNAKSTVKLRAPEFSTEAGVSFSAYIHPSNPDSGMYGGMSFVIFPVEDGPCLIGLGIGTQGLVPDDGILSRPGHSRKVAAICEWLNNSFGKGEIVAWAKQDPTRIDIDIPDQIKQAFDKYGSVFSRYGKVMYGIYQPDSNKENTKKAVGAFLDLMFEERGYTPLTAFIADNQQIKDNYYKYIFPIYEEKEILEILNHRRYVIIEGPPGTGKTRLAVKLLIEKYDGNGISIQFHANTTYENFIGGLSPKEVEGGFGFQFAPTKGHLLDAVIKANENPKKPYLLHIDEINRADLAKVLGEAIFLFESQTEDKRELSLPYDFGEPIHRTLSLPDNLHVLGTMNSSDRSTAILDIAIRRRFAFIKLWPDIRVVNNTNKSEIMKNAYKNLLDIFIEYASNDSINLMPGHAYFIADDDKLAKQMLKTGLLPLLEEYLAQGYVAGFSEHILAYMQWIKTL